MYLANHQLIIDAISTHCHDCFISYFHTLVLILRMQYELIALEANHIG